MTKSICSLLLLLLIGSAGFSQSLDSVLIDNEWRYVYPVSERIDFDRDYYDNFGLTYEEFPVWVQWKVANDPRANLKLKKLKNAIQRERYHRKEVTDSVYHKVKLSSHRGRYKEDYTKKDFRKNPRLLYAINTNRLEFVPPVVRDLPNGKYVQFFETYVTFDKRSKCKIVDRKVAAKFELKNNELQGHYERYTPDRVLLVSGNFEQGLKTGNWLETTEYDSDPFKYKKEINFWDETSKSDYISGLKNGKSYTYSNENLESIYNYKDEVPYGMVTRFNYSDSIVYDIFQTLDPFVNFSSLERTHGGRSLNWGTFKEDKSLADKYYMERIQPELFSSYPLNEPIEKVYPDSTLSMKNLKNLSLGYKTYQVFETYYKIYDRKTKKLIFQCYLDTVTKLYSGSSWYLNGQKFDTIWTDPLTMDLERIVYDSNGKIIFNTLEGDDDPETKIIDGFLAKPIYSDKKIVSYYYEAYRFDNDTVFRKIRWTPDGTLVSDEYRLQKDSISYSTVHFGNAYSKYEVNRERKLITYFENGIQLSATIPLKQEKDPVLDIVVNGQPYEGPVEFDGKNKSDKPVEFRNGKLMLGYRFYSLNSVEYGNVNYNLAQSRYSALKLMQLILLNFEDPDLFLKGVTGFYKNHHLDGPVMLIDKRSHRMQLNYADGKPNGKILIYKKRSKYNNDLDRHNIIDSTCHFKEQRFHKVYLSKSYSFKNGELDGPLVFYTNHGDTTGVIPFEKGLKNGKAFQYLAFSKMKAEFLNDKLINTLEVYSASRYSGYDTLWYVSFDHSGNMINGLYKTKYYKSKIQENVEWRGRFRSVENGRVLLEFSENNIVNEREWLEDYFVIRKDVIESGEVRYSEEFTGEKKPRSYLAPFSVIRGYDDNEKGIVWNRESVKHHNFQVPGFYRGSDYNDPKYPRYIKKYFSNGVILREGAYSNSGKYQESKSGVWKVNDYNGRKLYEIDYHDSVMKIGAQEWKTIGIQTEFDSLGNATSTRAVLSETETYECSSDDYYAERQYITLNSKIPARLNGLTKNYYDNGALMNEGKVVNGIPEGLWKFYTPDGKLTRLGNYQNGLENGKWLYGDLGEKAYIGEVCIDPNDPEYEFTLHQLEMDKEVEIVVYKNGLEVGSSTYSTMRNSHSSRDHIIEPNF